MPAAGRHKEIPWLALSARIAAPQQHRGVLKYRLLSGGTFTLHHRLHTAAACNIQHVRQAPQPPPARTEAPAGGNYGVSRRRRW